MFCEGKEESQYVFGEARRNHKIILERQGGITNVFREGTRNQKI